MGGFGGGGVSGSGTANRHAKFTGTNSIGDSSITDDGTNVNPSSDATPVLGSATTRWNSINLSVGVNVYGASADANPRAQLVAGGLSLGAGGGSAVDTTLARSAAGVWLCTSSMAFGTNPASTGTIRLPNNTSIIHRNAANNADLVALTRDGSNNLIIGTTTGAVTINAGAASLITLSQNGTAVMVLQAGGALNLPAGGTAATTGDIRLKNGHQIYFRNSGDTANRLGISFGPSGGGSDVITIGENTAGVTLTLNLPNQGLRINNQTSGAGAGAGTLGNAPAAGDPAFWMPINIAGTVRYFPCW